MFFFFFVFGRLGAASVNKAFPLVIEQPCLVVSGLASAAKSNIGNLLYLN